MGKKEGQVAAERLAQERHLGGCADKIFIALANLLKLCPEYVEHSRSVLLLQLGLGLMLLLSLLLLLRLLLARRLPCLGDGRRQAVACSQERLHLSKLGCVGSGHAKYHITQRRTGAHDSLLLVPKRDGAESARHPSPQLERQVQPHTAMQSCCCC